MRFALDRARKLISVGGLVRCARSFYELIGNRRKAVRQPTSGNIFATFHGIVANSTYACLCVDVSLKGIGVECHEPMTVDATAELHSDEHSTRRLVVVRYCLKRGESYRVGLEFISDTEMNARRTSAARAQAGQRATGTTASV
jgi:hypothetical protein